jgi:hypothetical protein
VPYYDNPAGRLHELLRKLGEQNRGDSLLNAWAEVLRVKSDDVVLHIGSVANLVRQIQDAVDRAGEEALIAPVRRYRGVWARPIFPPEEAYNNPLKSVLPDDAALESLELVSAQLHSIAPDGVVPDADQLEELKSQLREVVSAVREATDLPDDVKHLIVARLLDVEEAIEHLDVGGPEAIRRATEAVMGGLMFTRDVHVAKSQTVTKVWTTLLVLWAVFSAGPTIQASIEAWHEIVPALEAQSSAPADDDNQRRAVSDEDPPAKSAQELGTSSDLSD